MKAWKMTNKKKVRGWKKQIKKIEKWKQSVWHLDMAYLAQHQRDYAKLWIDPWYRLIRRNPPLWYRRLLLQAMFEVYMNWYKQLKATGEEFYLRIWLYEPNFINSQIVVAYRDFLDFYDQALDEASYQRVFPSSKYAYRSLCSLLEMFNWELKVETNLYFERDLIEGIEQRWHSDKYVERVKQRAYEVTTFEGDTVYCVRVGDVLVGELKSNNAE